MPPLETIRAEIRVWISAIDPWLLGHLETTAMTEVDRAVGVARVSLVGEVVTVVGVAVVEGVAGVEAVAAEGVVVVANVAH